MQLIAFLKMLRAPDHAERGPAAARLLTQASSRTPTGRRRVTGGPPRGPDPRRGGASLRAVSREPTSDTIVSSIVKKPTSSPTRSARPRLDDPRSSRPLRSARALSLSVLTAWRSSCVRARRRLAAGDDLPRRRRTAGRGSTPHLKVDYQTAGGGGRALRSHPADGRGQCRRRGGGPPPARLRRRPGRPGRRRQHRPLLPAARGRHGDHRDADRGRHPGRRRQPGRPDAAPVVVAHRADRRGADPPRARRRPERRSRRTGSRRSPERSGRATWTPRACCSNGRTAARRSTRRSPAAKP